MKKSIGTIDKVTRILLAVIIVFLCLTNAIIFTSGVTLFAASQILGITGFLSFCSISLLMGFKTIRTKS